MFDVRADFKRRVGAVFLTVSVALGACAESREGSSTQAALRLDSVLFGDASAPTGPDAGTPDYDSGTPDYDSGTPGFDSGTPDFDSGTVTDGDAGAPVDTDASAGIDAGGGDPPPPGPDAGGGDDAGDGNPYQIVPSYCSWTCVDTGSGAAPPPPGSSCTPLADDCLNLAWLPFPLTTFVFAETPEPDNVRALKATAAFLKNSGKLRYATEAATYTLSNYDADKKQLTGTISYDGDTWTLKYLRADPDDPNLVYFEFDKAVQISVFGKRVVNYPQKGFMFKVTESDGKAYFRGVRYDDGTTRTMYENIGIIPGENKVYMASTAVRVTDQK